MAEMQPEGQRKDEEKITSTNNCADSEVELEIPPATTQQQVFAVLAAFLVNMLTLGTTQSFGILQRHCGSDAAYRDGVLPPDHGERRATIAAIGTLGNGGVVSAIGAWWLVPMIPCLGPKIKVVCLVAAFIMAIGWGIASSATRMVHLMMTQGLLSGLGCGILLNTVPTILPEYFDKHSGWAQGIAATGSGVGGVLFSPLLSYLLQTVKTRKALGIFATIFLVLGCTAGAVAQPARKVKTRCTQSVGRKAFQQPMFLLFFLFTFLVSMSFRTPMAFGSEFSKMLGYEPKVSAGILAAISGTGIITRPVFGLVSDKFGHQNMLLLSMAVYATSVFCVWLPAAAYHSEAAWIVFAIICGALNGSFLQFSVSVAQAVFGEELYFSYSGAFAAVRGVGFVIGNPIGGALIKKVRNDAFVGSDFYLMIIFTGVTLTGGALCLVAIRYLNTKARGPKLLD